MLAILKNPAFFQTLSLAGALSAVLGAFVSGLAYRGRQGERYSPLTHFISELGEVGVSRLAMLFNLGLILCGLCLLPACISLGLLLPGIWSKLGMLAGVVTTLSIALVGVFPMNKMTPHTRAAVTYFRMGLVMVIFFTLAILFQPRNLPLLSRWLGLAGLPAVLAYTFFLLYSRVSYNPAASNALDPQDFVRPRFWGVAAAEWAVFLTTIPWLLAIAAGF